MAYNTLQVELRDGVLTVTLNRPDVHNAFNDELIAEAIDLFSNIDTEAARAVVLKGTGRNFCAGADLNWMSRMVSYTREENIRDSSLLAKMYALINECPLPVVGRIQGAAIGGRRRPRLGLRRRHRRTNTTQFGLSEVKLGILPAVISPYVIGKIGPTHARALFLTGERFDAERALAHRSRAPRRRRRSGPARRRRLRDHHAAQDLRPRGRARVQETDRHVASHELADAIPYTIDAIATRRVSEEGQVGMQAFLEKKLAPWITN